MKCQFLPMLLVFCLVTGGCQNEVAKSGDKATPSVVEKAAPVSTTTFVNQVVEASCGQCQFGMEGKGCDLAVKINGKTWYVDGTSLDGHGDAHGDDGMCNCIRQATVTGEIKDGRFVSTAFELLPLNEN